jgi:hypothetical protein
MSTLQPKKHAAIIREVAEHIASGAFDAGYYAFEGKSEMSEIWLVMTPTIELNERWHYQVIKTHKHPDNRPKKKLIDWGKMPIGAMTNRGELVDVLGVVTRNVLGSHNFHASSCSELRLVEQNDFTFWGGGECPVPDGVVVEAVYRGRACDSFSGVKTRNWWHTGQSVDIIGYRVTGLEEGWTDNPEEAV